MSITHFPQAAKKFEIQVYKRPEDLNQLKQHHVPFSGSPRRHPYDSQKVILVADPYGSINLYYEFVTADVTYVEELPNLVNVEGEAIPMARLWVKRGSVGIQSIPFWVEDTRRANR